MPNTTKRKGKARPKVNGVDVTLAEQRRAVQRTLRAQKRVRTLVAQLRRSSALTTTYLMDLHEELTSTFGARDSAHHSGAATTDRAGAGDESRGL